MGCDQSTSSDSFKPSSIENKNQQDQKNQSIISKQGKKDVNYNPDKNDKVDKEKIVVQVKQHQKTLPVIQGKYNKKSILSIPIAIKKIQFLNKSQIQNLILQSDSTKQLLSKETLVKTIEDVNKMYISKQNLIQLMQFYETYCKVSIENLQQIQQSDSFWSELGQNFLKLSTNIFFDNLDTLVVLNTVVKNIGALKDIKENSFQQINKIFKLFRFGPCQRDSNAFAYLYMYLELHCKQMEKQNKKVVQISSWFKQILQKLTQEYPPAPKLQQSQQIHKHATFKQKPQNYSQPKLSLLDIPKDEKRNKIMIFIQAQASQADKNMKQFTKFVSSICRQCNGSHLKIGIKLNNISDQKATSRVIQKLFKKELKQYKKKISSKQSFQSLDNYFRKEKKYFDEALQSIIQNKSQLTFTISDMLRGKCVFQTVQDINICAQKMKQRIIQKKYQLIQLDNRLLGQTGTSDVVFKIKIGQTITEFQLALQVNNAQNGFAHKIYEIQRSTFFDPVNFLRIYNQTFSKDYLQKTVSIIQMNNKFSTLQEQQTIYHDKTKQSFSTFHQIKSIWSELNSIFLYQWKDDLDQDNYRIEVKRDQLSMVGYECIVRNLSNKHYFINGLFLSGMKKHKQAMSQLNKIIEFKDEKQKKKVLKKNASQLFDIGNVKQALSVYLKCLELEKAHEKGIQSMDVATTLNNIGRIYKHIGNNSEAIKYLKECLEKEQRIQGKGSINTAVTINNIGRVYMNMGNNSEALKYYKECLEIKQRIKGKGSINTTVTLNNIGGVYKHIGNNFEALKYYKESLEIEQRIKGKGSINTALTINNIGQVYKNIGNNSEALKQYNECLEIQQRIKGKGSIDTAETLRNIGQVYRNMGNNSEALKYCNECLKIQQRIQEKGSINTAITLRNIGQVYRNMGNNSEALKYFCECFEIQQRIKGKGSIDTAATLSSFGYVYQNLGQINESLRCSVQAFQICFEIYGQSHYITQDYKNRMQIVKAKLA